MKRTHQAIFLALMMATMSLTGCFGGDENGSDEDETPVETLDDWQVHFANSVSDLPECNDDRDGWLYYVSADEKFRVCTQFGWELVDITGPSGADGQDGAPGADGQDGADGADGQDGAPGADGLDGVDGDHGTDGVDGVDGDHGDDGQDGTSILINVVNSTSCLNGGNTFEIGNDDDADGALSVTEIQVTVDICNGAQGPAGADGADGADGQDGQDGVDGVDGDHGDDGNSTLTVTTNLSSSSSNCWGDGGVQIDVGVDDNNNGVLESSEIDDTTYICNGGDGADGDSAYQIWLNNGNTGSEQDFLDSLEGRFWY